MNITDLKKRKNDLGGESDSVNQAIVTTRAYMEQGKVKSSAWRLDFPGFLAQFCLKVMPKPGISRTEKGRGELQKFLEVDTFISVGLGDHLKTPSTRRNKSPIDSKCGKGHQN